MKIQLLNLFGQFVGSSSSCVNFRSNLQPDSEDARRNLILNLLVFDLNLNERCEEQNIKGQNNSIHNL